jgi:cell division protein FtsW
MVIVTGLSPVSGQPLPFISKGGTSILVMSAAIGMMLSVSRFASSTNSNKKTIKAELKELPEDIQTENPLQIQNSEYK